MDDPQFTGDDPRLKGELDRVRRLIDERQFDAALALCRDLVQRNPVAAEGWFWLGYLQSLGGQLPGAEAALLRAVELDPSSPLYRTNLSIAALGQGRATEAEQHARQAISLEGDNAAHWINLGNALIHQRRLAEAADAYRAAIARQADDAAAWGNLAAATEQQGDLAAAQEAYERHLTLAPSPEVGLRYAALLVCRGLPQQAIHIFQQIAAQVPSLTQAWLGLGDSLSLVGDPVAAEAAYRRALALDPRSRAGRLSLGLALVSQFRLAEAEDLVRPLVVADPNDAGAWALLSTIELSQGQAPAALDAGRRAVALGRDPARYGRMLTAMQYVEEVEPAALLAEHRVFDELYARGLSPHAGLLPEGEERFAPAAAAGVLKSGGGRPLRIGLASANFGRHPIAFLALPALEQLDKSRCSLVCYSDRLDEDPFTARFRAAADEWHTTEVLSDEALYDRIRADEIDVLIDLMGHTGRRLLVFARRPAPVQVTWLGYVGTTGLAAMDYLLADRFHVRPGEERWHSETVLRLPHSYACYAPPPYMPEVSPLPAAAAGHVTFGSLSNPAKFNPRLLDAWAAILERVPGSQLLLKFGGLSEPQVQRRIHEHFARQGIEGSRVLLEGNAPHPELLAAYRRIDIALDTQPYSGGVTTCEALWMGVPVITFPGRTFAGRHATSYLSTAGLSEFVAADMAGYVELAVRWAGRIDELAHLRGTLRDRLQQSPVGDSAGFANDWLSALREAYAARISAVR